MMHIVLVAAGVVHFGLVIAQAGDLPQGAQNVKKCGPVCAYYACKYYGVDVKLDDLVTLCKTDSEGTTLSNLRAALIEEGLYAEGYHITPEALLRNHKYFMILPVKEWTDRIDHYDVVMGSKDDGVLLLNYPTRPWFFDITKLTKYWDGQVLLISNEPIENKNVISHLNGTIPKENSYPRAVALIIILISGCILMCNIYTLVRIRRPQHAA
jgi:ABC-type bacteriocin/lantibiotic exporter with double-glycine peptidase domain